MKTRAFFTILLSVSSLLLTSCIRIRHHSESGETVNDSRTVKPFSEVSVSALTVYLVPSEENKVIVEADKNLTENVITEVSQDRLNIYLRSTLFSWNARKAKVYVFFKNLEELKLDRGADAFSQSPLAIKDLDLKVTGGSDGKLELKSENIYCYVSGGSDLKLSGSVKKIEARVSGGSDLYCKKLICKSAAVRVSGGSDACVHASEKIDLQASGGSDIIYYGKPPQTKIHASGGSDILKREL
ncbi:MAG: DUF2807 domain-containing protein [Cytophagales bacterium]|nr:DUF2807 domain-containing protein [Cytophagales bacterium]